MDQTHVVEAHGLRRTYKTPRRPDHVAVAGVDLRIRRGELFALLGTNGSGKTSIMEVLEGHVPPTAGTCTVFGLDPYQQRGPVRSRTGIVLQEGSLQNDLTVRETMTMWAGTLTSPRPIEEALELVDLTGRAAVTVNRLSGGERRRLDFAVAILGRPELLFLDEPTTGLDPESRARTHGLMRDLLDHGTTIVLTTHYLQEAEDLADRLAILHRGVVVAQGTPPEIVSSTPARISFSMPPGSSGPNLDARTPLDTELGAELPKNATMTEETNSHGRCRTLIRTFDLQSSLEVVLAWASRNGLKLQDLEARPASLEQAFLALAEVTPVALDEEKSA